MDTEKCRALLCVLETGSLSAAAAALGYTPSGVSRMMAALEQETGFPLLARSRSGVVATEACTQLLPAARELAHWGALYAEQAAAVRGLETGAITVGSAYSACYDWLSQTIARFSAAHPSIEVRVLQGTSTYLCAALAEHRADFCIVSRREGRFEWIPLWNDPLVAWLPRTHPRARDAAFPLRAFETEPYIGVFPAQDTDNDRAFARAGITPNTHYTTVDRGAAYAMVKAGLGVCLCNALLSRGMDAGGVAVLPVDPPQIVEIGIAAPRREELSPAARRFLEFARARLPELDEVNFSHRKESV